MQKMNRSYKIFKYIFIVFLNSLFISIEAQNNNVIDSLSKLIKSDYPDTNNVKNLNTLAWEFMFQNPDTAMILTKQALELATSIAESPSAAQNIFLKRTALKCIAKSNSYLGVYYELAGKYAIALSFHFKALEIRNTIGEKGGVASSLTNIALVYDSQGDFPKALEYLFQALKINIELDEKKYIATTLANIGQIYYKLSEYHESLRYSMLSLALNEKYGDKNKLAIVLGNIGEAYHKLNNYSRATKYHLKALKTAEETGNKYAIAIQLSNIGSLYMEQGMNAIALEWFNNALKTSLEINERSFIANNQCKIGTIYLMEKDYRTAERYLLESFNISTDIGALEHTMNCTDKLADLYAQTNRFELAYKYHQHYSITKDSLFNEEKSKEIGKLEGRHEIQMAEMEHKKTEMEELRIKTEQRKRNHLLQYSGILVLLILIALTVVVLGFKKVSSAMASTVSFFAFLLLFEFLLVLLDPFIDRLSHGEPVYKLFFNALIAACIFPFHAFFEKILRKKLIKGMPDITT